MSKRIAPAVLAVLALVIAIAHANMEDCLFNTDDGFTYDLSAFSTSEMSVPGDRGDVLYFSACRAVHDRGCGVDTASCLVPHFQPSSPINYGSLVDYALTTSMTAKGQGLTVSYRHGDRCSSGAERKTTVTFLCDPAVTMSVDDFEEKECHAILSIRSRFACPVIATNSTCPTFSEASACKSQCECGWCPNYGCMRREGYCYSSMHTSSSCTSKNNNGDNKKNDGSLPTSAIIAISFASVFVFLLILAPLLVCLTRRTHLISRLSSCIRRRRSSSSSSVSSASSDNDNDVGTSLLIQEDQPTEPKQFSQETIAPGFVILTIPSISNEAGNYMHSIISFDPSVPSTFRPETSFPIVWPATSSSMTGGSRVSDQ
eukprot:TRINITY_DN3489_c0_g1_i1.p1 TRINITY_DN3489_c0_g1~~TRINITY_DN3489_c0_g1_i1.p1  ORF type:complete len:381 (-),score=119.34 TRINITY_DN3489_c0_g1_i1:149-1264(-)